MGNSLSATEEAIRYLYFSWSACPRWPTLPRGVRPRYNKGGYATALTGFLPLAERGDAIAQLRLGYMYEFGRGVPQNDKKAPRWFRAAAEQGNDNAQFTLGFLYEVGIHEVGIGRIVLQDYKEAVRWYGAAAEQANASAQFLLGCMYEEGWGVPQDYIQAHMWFNLAASNVLGNDEMAKRRDSVATKMTPEQISEAQRLARSGSRRRHSRWRGWRNAILFDSIGRIQADSEREQPRNYGSRARTAGAEHPLGTKQDLAPNDGLGLKWRTNGQGWPRTARDVADQAKASVQKDVKSPVLSVITWWAVESICFRPYDRGP